VTEAPHDAPRVLRSWQTPKFNVRVEPLKMLLLYAIHQLAQVLVSLYIPRDIRIRNTHGPELLVVAICLFVDPAKPNADRTSIELHKLLTKSRLQYRASSSMTFV